MINCFKLIFHVSAAFLLGIVFLVIKEHYSNSIEHSESTHKTVKRDLKPDSYFENIPKNDINEDEERIFTTTELKNYDGSEGSQGLYIAIMGEVFDVSKGEKHYGVGCSYNFFAGRDASTSFISGEFETVTDKLDDVLSLGSREMLSLKQWKDFYHKDYIYRGKVIGRFFDKNGEPTEYSKLVEQQIKNAIDDKARELRLEDEYPGCNIEWKADTGSRVWCTINSGGKTRDYVGVPRKLFKVGDKSFRCACLRPDQLSLTNIEEYENCESNSDTCYYKLND